jgi:hypothetical protein
MQYKSFFNFEQYKHAHKRHDPPGSEDADVNNDGKIDKNDKYIMAKRRLYRQYQAAQKSTKSTEFSTPKLENNMIRLSGLVNLQALKEESHEEPAPTAAVDKKSLVGMKLKKLKGMQMTPDQEKKVDELLVQMEELTAKQKQLDVDKDGKIEADDLAKLRAGKTTDEAVGEDHEVSMASKTLDSIIKHATELKGKIGTEEKDIPAWIQDHIAVAENNLDQANTSYHEYGDEDKTDTPVDQDMAAMKEGLNEAAPEGWEKTVLAMKKHKEIDNPWALAHWMKKKGYHPRNEAQGLDEKAKWRSSSAAVKTSSPDGDDWDDYHRENPRSTGRLKSKADTPSDTGSLSRRTPGQIATKGPNKGKLSASSASTLKGRIKSGRSTQAMTKNTKKVKNPKTGKEILATTAINDPSHPAYNAAKAALGKK